MPQHKRRFYHIISDCSCFIIMQIAATDADIWLINTAML